MQNKIKAKKQHLCNSCETLIKAGDIYELTKLKVPKYAQDAETQIGIEFLTFKSCISCCEKIEKEKAAWLNLIQTDEYQYQQSTFEHKYP